MRLLLADREQPRFSRRRRSLPAYRILYTTITAGARRARLERYALWWAEMARSDAAVGQVLNPHHTVLPAAATAAQLSWSTIHQQISVSAAIYIVSCDEHM